MGHDHGPPGGREQRGRLAIALAVTVVILVAEVVGAVVTGSLALLVDSAHMLTDAGGLAVAVLAASLALRAPTSRRTWGFRRAEVLAALGQAAVLVAVGILVLVEGVRRLIEPPDIPSTELIVFGVVGLVGNLVSIAVLASHRSGSFNLRAAFLEVLNDALGSLGVIIAAVVIATTGWQRADAVAALLIGALIVPRALKILRETVAVLLETVPPGLDLDEVRSHLVRLEHVRDVHDMHASLIATGLPVITAHVVVEMDCFTSGHAPDLLDRLQECLATHFDVSVEHSTFQLEPETHAGHETTGHG
ncbi:cation diffusion facilitator family transporter [Isoptericola sp. b441]|uniref:Cation diffusion facilitator family transporter n=1 Tax=Actinotalea lenta TaxID=3064654 RepID=A0ABT9DAV3_9CELL|nr:MULTISPECIES: cation diffusion facilitator family transporter [unclassified Isoptericola]MDO8108034.1 cation diffusion facilitator family transporter [Isoptericola sp. b441]MDO8120297.1 cation diffusion facilitator family transporter [Isoptericola sp. b490]